MGTKLTIAERLILANQFEILGHLQDAKEHLLMAGHLRDGHEYLYRDLLGSVSPEMDEETSDFVLDVLSMYRAMQSSFKKLGSPASVKQDEIAWKGFDGNNEGELYSFTRALASDGRFDELLGEHGINSHMPMKRVYRGMVAVWRALGDSKYQLSAEQIRQIIQAKYNAD